MSARSAGMPSSRCSLLAAMLCEEEEGGRSARAGARAARMSGHRRGQHWATRTGVEFRGHLSRLGRGVFHHLRLVQAHPPKMQAQQRARHRLVLLAPSKQPRCVAAYTCTPPRHPSTRQRQKQGEVQWRHRHALMAHTHTHTHTHTCARSCACACACARTSADTHICARAHTYIYAYTRPALTHRVSRRGAQGQ